MTAIVVKTSLPRAQRAPRALLLSATTAVVWLLLTLAPNASPAPIEPLTTTTGTTSAVLAGSPYR